MNNQITLYAPSWDNQWIHPDLLLDKETKMDHVDLMFVRDAIATRDEEAMDASVELLQTAMFKFEEAVEALDDGEEEDASIS
jgi:hypothetical protein